MDYAFSFLPFSLIRMNHTSIQKKISPTPQTQCSGNQLRSVLPRTLKRRLNTIRMNGIAKSVQTLRNRTTKRWLTYIKLTDKKAVTSKWLYRLCSCPWSNRFPQNNRFIIKDRTIDLLCYLIIVRMLTAGKIGKLDFLLMFIRN